jgi:signal peptidase I
MAVATHTKRPSGGGSPRNVVAAARGKRTASRKPSRRLWENIKSLLGALAIFLVIRTFFVEAFRIPSGSMEPTLLVGDFLFVNKLVYGPRIPFTDFNLPGYTEPRRGEVVIYTSPDDRDGNPTVVKRIVGVAGDTLFMRDGLLYVNGSPQRQGYAAISEPEFLDESSPDFEWQKRVHLEHSRFAPAPDQPTHDNWGPFVVPPEHFFTLGDSRYNSKDARYYGFVPRENVRGRPLFIYYSYDAVHSDSPIPWITDIRWRRIGHRIQ